MGFIRRQKLKLIPAFVALDLKTDEDQKDWLFKHAQDVELCLAESLAERSITTTTIIAAGESKLVGLPPEVLDEWYVKQNGRVALATIKASLGSLSASGKAVEYSNEDSTKTNKKTSLFFLFAFWYEFPQNPSDHGPRTTDHVKQLVFLGPSFLAKSTDSDLQKSFVTRGCTFACKFTGSSVDSRLSTFLLRFCGFAIA